MLRIIRGILYLFYVGLEAVAHLCDCCYQYLRDGGSTERALPVAADAHDGAVGQARLHPHPAAPAGHAQTPLPDGQAQVQHYSYL